MKQIHGLFLSKMTQVGTPIALISTIFLSSCGPIGDLTDKMLFGTTLDAESRTSCSPKVIVDLTTIALSESGDQDTDGVDRNNTGDLLGGPWGYYEREFCVSLRDSFTTGTVEIPITVTGDTSRFTVGTSIPTSLTFTPANYSTPQCVLLTANDDAVRNTDDSPIKIALGKPLQYDDEEVYRSVEPCDISVTVEDDDRPGVLVSAMSNVTNEPPAAPTTGTFTVKLRNGFMPTANVTVPINALYDPKNASYREGVIKDASCTSTITSLTFTPANYNTAQTVCVEAQQDYIEDGTVQWTIQLKKTISTDSTYSGLDPRDVAVINVDADEVGYTITPFQGSSTSTDHGSAGTISGMAVDDSNNLGSNYARFKMKLRSRPQSSVVLNFSTANPAESRVVNPTITFTTSNWNTDQWVYVEGKSDGASDGNHDFNVTFSVTTTDTYYSTAAKPTFSIRSCDNDNGNEIQLCNFSGSPLGTSGGRFTVNEPTSSTYLWLITATPPGSTISVPFTSSKPDEGSVSDPVTITASNYNKLESTGSNRIVLTAVDDTILDDTQTWEADAGTASGGSTYAGTPTVYAQTTDNETRYKVTKTGNTNEDETTTATIEIYLDAEPTANIVMDVTCTSSGDECLSVSPTTITFYAGEFGSSYKQTITVTGKNDDWSDGNQNFLVKFNITSGDSVFDTSHDPSDVTITNVDNDNPGKAIFVTSGSYEGEMTGVAGADDLCNNNKPGGAPSGTYKALIISDSATGKRLATTNGVDATGQANWILNANTRYYRIEGGSGSDETSRVFETNAAKLIEFPMTRDFASNAGYTYWTGMNADMTPATQASTPAKQDPEDPDYRHNCAGWTYNKDPGNTVDYYGEYWLSSGGSITNANDLCEAPTRRLICVQQ